MRDFNIIADSSCDLTPDLDKSLNRKRVPFFLDFDEKRVVDDGTHSQGEILSMIEETQDAPKTAAPSPYEFLKYIEEGKENFIITISSKLSATYSNALLAVEMAKEKTEDLLVHVFDSKSASSGESLIAIKTKEFIDQGLSFDEIVNKMEDFIKGMKTIFVLDSIENLMKNGRMSRLQGFVASVLSIKPVLYGENGEIKLKDKPRGLKKAYQRMIDLIGEDKASLVDKTIVIAHAGAEEMAKTVKKKIEEIYNPKKVYLFETGGLSTIYADKGGIVISY